MKILELVEKAKTRASLSSDYALAKAIGIERQVISQWKSGKRHPSNAEAVQLATLAGIDEMEVIAQIELETAKTEPKKEFWKHYIESRGFAAVGAMAICGTVLLLQNYDEQQSAEPRVEKSQNIHYA